jgi:hypothetical protein
MNFIRHVSVFKCPYNFHVVLAHRTTNPPMTHIQIVQLPGHPGAAIAAQDRAVGPGHAQSGARPRASGGPSLINAAQSVGLSMNA